MFLSPSSEKSSSRRRRNERRGAITPQISPKSISTRRSSGSVSEQSYSPPSFATDSPEGDITRTYADINLLIGTIEDHISGKCSLPFPLPEKAMLTPKSPTVLHLEMSNRAQKNKTPEYRRIEAHLESQRYPTPKSSIGSKSSSKSGSRRRSTINLTTKRSQLWAA